MDLSSIEHFSQSAYFIDSDHPNVKAYANQVIQGIDNPRDQAVALYNDVRDSYLYNPYEISLQPRHSKASGILAREKKSGHCIDKAIILCALGRAVDIPTRLHFANVKNHIATEKLEEYLGTDILVFHGYMEFYLDGQWVKCTPAFNKSLCDKLNVATLEFDGVNDSIFQEYDRSGADFMEYLHDYGVFHDFPLDMFEKEIRIHYRKVFERLEKEDVVKVRE